MQAMSLVPATRSPAPLSRRRRGLLRVAVIVLAGGACTAPPPRQILREAVLRDVAVRWPAFFPIDPHGAHGVHGFLDAPPGRDGAVLRPRFGLPVIARAGDGFEIERLERGGPIAPAELRAALVARGVDEATAARCLATTTDPDSAPVPGCFPLELEARDREAVTAEVSVARDTARPRPGLAPPPGGYDLWFGPRLDPAPASTTHPPVRLRSAVWLRAEDPATLEQVRVAHMSDLHVGKGDASLIARNIRRVIAAVNAARPDVVVVTGDVVNLGQDGTLGRQAEALLAEVEAPLLAVVGNHDIGFGREAMLGRDYGAGWSNFARVFHPWLHFRVRLGRWDFIGFDSGASSLSPRILTRGLAPETLASLRAQTVEARAGGRGVVLFSHAPTRALLSPRDPTARGHFGQMSVGGEALEAVLLEAAAAGQQAVHLAGHTHWADLFEAVPDRRGQLRFVERAEATSGCAGEVIAGDRGARGQAVLVTAQSASHAGIGRRSAAGFGWDLVTLGEGPPRVAFHRLGVRGLGCTLAGR